ncbi:MAG: GNAT family N-acetyltransferase [Sphingobacterium composti]|uniref:GNAT family N-acetyltransferase n=1 Tax=Sphingobacterium composti TaxID=363260 RepID=UPI001357689E|nr:GNAT family N-acetyltransferase [Sphingobacterium composti Ten et al. 2007 non Yoo et al. 2007]
MKTKTSDAFTITLAEKDIWTQYVSNAYKYDFYHTWDYHDLAKIGEPILFVYEDEDDYIALPLLKRPVPNSNYIDFHSVYGYTGPISNKDFDDLNDQFINNFQNVFLQFLKEQNCLSVFVKFHPFFNQVKALEGMGGVYDNGKVVAVDLIQPLENQHKRYRTQTRKTIRKTRELGFYTRLKQSQEDISAFTKLYNQSMDRIGASSFYKFNEAYFTSLLNSKQCNAKLLLVFFEDKLVCGSVITFTKGIIQAHLLATDIEYLRYSPAKFMNDEICLMGREMGMEYFHLGGGQGYQDNSLFDWKLGFSDLVLPHKSWRFIVDQDAYNIHVEQSGNDINNPIDFFPLYRLNQ